MIRERSELIEIYKSLTLGGELLSVSPISKLVSVDVQNAIICVERGIFYGEYSFGFDTAGNPGISVRPIVSVTLDGSLVEVTSKGILRSVAPYSGNSQGTYNVVFSRLRVNATMVIESGHSFDGFLLRGTRETIDDISYTGYGRLLL